MLQATNLMVTTPYPSTKFSLVLKNSDSDSAQQQIIKRWKTWIEAQEKILETDKTILFGDFNLNPQEIALYSHEGLCAHATINNSTRVKTKYYNPMWSTLGDFIYKTDIPKVPELTFGILGKITLTKFIGTFLMDYL